MADDLLIGVVVIAALYMMTKSKEKERDKAIVRGAPSEEEGRREATLQETMQALAAGVDQISREFDDIKQGGHKTLPESFARELSDVYEQVKETYRTVERTVKGRSDGPSPFEEKVVEELRNMASACDQIAQYELGGEIRKAAPTNPLNEHMEGSPPTVETEFNAAPTEDATMRELSPRSLAIAVASSFNEGETSSEGVSRLKNREAEASGDGTAVVGHKVINLAEEDELELTSIKRDSAFVDSGSPQNDNTAAEHNAQMRNDSGMTTAQSTGQGPKRVDPSPLAETFNTSPPPPTHSDNPPALPPAGGRKRAQTAPVGSAQQSARVESAAIQNSFGQSGPRPAVTNTPSYIENLPKTMDDGSFIHRSQQMAADAMEFFRKIPKRSREASEIAIKNEWNRRAVPLQFLSRELYPTEEMIFLAAYNEAKYNTPGELSKRGTRTVPFTKAQIKEVRELQTYNAWRTAYVQVEGAFQAWRKKRAAAEPLSPTKYGQNRRDRSRSVVGRTTRSGKRHRGPGGPGDSR